MRIKITFAGSFQCRLATDTDKTDASPDVPGIFPGGAPFGALGSGWTFAWYEPPEVKGKPSLDRIIRLSNPYLLRSAMVDDWEDTRVTLVEASRSLGLYTWPLVDEPLGDDIILVPVRADPLLGQVVSLGEAKFAGLTPGTGSGDGHEVLVDFAFSIGGMLFQAKQVGKTKGAGANYLGDEVKNFYRQTKAPLVKALLNDDDTPKNPAVMHPARAKYLSEYSPGESKAKGHLPRHIFTYGTFFMMDADMFNIPLTQVQIRANRGILSLIAKANLAWKLSLNWSRFDGDTLTGKVKGVLEGSDSLG
jgi:hypothetical protein